MSKDLRRRGWSFVGPTTAYAAMQARGIVNDHLIGCHARDANPELYTRFEQEVSGFIADGIEKVMNTYNAVAQAANEDQA